MAQELREGAEWDPCVSVGTHNSSLQIYSSSLQVLVPVPVWQAGERRPADWSPSDQRG